MCLSRTFPQIDLKVVGCFDSDLFQCRIHDFESQVEDDRGGKMAEV